MVVERFRPMPSCEECREFLSNLGASRKVSVHFIANCVASRVDHHMALSWRCQCCLAGIPCFDYLFDPQVASSGIHEPLLSSMQEARLQPSPGAVAA